ncbi:MULTISPECIES: HlyD family type I secretion periplasmic adaptor subunit [Pantoea]|jgi:adhesin transport system membrane fusion protein|uniref:Membrane fusion protein (MFP) family protein n=1 Tax=Pantoea piersonii TaxID=2364647 RepID=A0AAJ5UAE3_9GAMM|nr:MULTISPECIES: HlyD family type I secretion periplasmic adaptor subunit [Pantoea]MBZ6385775.1 HlyD family type I secretion periplasmic adaptor subunit [Pantoea piersonii]MBZ6399146.1 HlyD family type I secretion periplasmic adaptor subunit [Pantoea piersonii]MBZ6406468.1 HlyD family type I secretion periplasmic adaptor subunit [Pantoea piersonii]NYB02192.1 HlyD family type I secretion periplasmic adaptor subunit [Pantoea piersonii]NYB06779.1 HlyD family type I secretion periplasmic adaptor s
MSELSTKLRLVAPEVEASDDINGDLHSESYYSGAVRLIVISFFLLLAGLIWAWFGVLDEVSTGTGKVIPSSRDQVLSSLEGGILAELNVHEGDRVEAGQIVAKLDPTRSVSSVGESAARYRAALAASARLYAEVNDQPLRFPAELKAFPDLIASETRLYNTRRAQLKDSTAQIQESLGLANRELAITQRLAKTGAASSVEVLRLQRDKSDLELKLTDMRSQYYVQAREDLAKASAEADSLAQTVKGREDTVSRLTLRSPMRGIVKNIKVTTVGGVIPPNGELMNIVPMDDRLLIEARLSPRDIAFIHPGQKALVKISAYDYAIYGGLHGVVESISPDTIQDEVKPEIYYYRVFIRTETDYVQNKAGRRFSISPGMVSTVDIKTGEKTVMDYLVKPFNRAKEALRER